MRIEQSKQPCALGQPGKQMQVVSFQPSIECPVTNSFEREQQRQGHHFARMKRCLRVFSGILHLVVYTAKQFYDNMFGSHGILLYAFGLGTYSIGESRSFSN
jgi:hypothetical protein